jgi:hypothetical protein
MRIAGLFLIASVPALSQIDTLHDPLLAKVRSATWHTGCPVAPEDLRVLTIRYLDYNKAEQAGQLIAHKDVAQEVLGIFRKLLEQKFQIERMNPVEDYGGDDEKSMEANNTSAFNCRDITLQPGKFSNHSWGRAIDINPLTNPYIKGTTVLPPEGRRHLDRAHRETGIIVADSPIVKMFRDAGWQWGGSWTDRKDYQHFEKSGPVGRVPRPARDALVPLPLR